MRYASSQLDSQVRILALSTSLADAKDLGEWIGASDRGIFNFAPGVRPVPLQIHIEGANMANSEALTRPTYTAIAQHVRLGKPGLVFVSTNENSRLTALDLVSYAVVDSDMTWLSQQYTQRALISFLSRISDSTLQHTLRHGVGYLHEELSARGQEVVTELFEDGVIHVCVASSDMCWGMRLTSHLVVVMGAQHDIGRENPPTDCPIPDLLQMIGRIRRPEIGSAGQVLVLCPAGRKDYYKKFLLEPLPVESQLHRCFHDHLNAELGVLIHTKKDAVDYLTWTFLYMRLTQNPKYYNVPGVSCRNLVDATLTDLEASKCVAIKDQMDLFPLNLGRLAAHYSMSYTTVALLNSSLGAKTKLKGLLQLLASALEYSDKPMTGREGKAYALMQAQFSRKQVAGNLASEQLKVLIDALPLSRAIVIITSTAGWLTPTLRAMTTCKMFLQGLWHQDSELLQLPHLTAERVKSLHNLSIKTVHDLKLLEHEAVPNFLPYLSAAQMEDVFIAIRRYPDVAMSIHILNENEVYMGRPCWLHVTTKRRHLDEGPVHSPRYPKVVPERWWLLLGEEKSQKLLAITHAVLSSTEKTIELEFLASHVVGTKVYTLRLIIRVVGSYDP